MQHATLVYAAVATVVAWRVVVRVRRLVGRQRSQLWRHRAVVLVLPFLLGLLMIGALGEWNSLLALAGGAAAGGILALVGFRRSRLEVTADGGCYYTPFGPIGLALAALLVGRIAYHALRAFETRGSAATAVHAFGLTPMTLFVFALLAAYYSAYSLGLLLWRARLGRSR